MLKYLLQKEFLQIRRNKFLPRLIFLFPIVIMCVMPWVMDMEVRNIVVEVVDNAHTPLSSRLIHCIEASDYFVFRGTADTYNQALSHVEEGTTDIILEIRTPKAKASLPAFHIAANAVNGTKGSLGTNYLSQIIAQEVSQKATLSLISRSTSQIEPAAQVPNASVFYLYNPHLNYKLYMIPALTAILIMLFTGFLPALNIVSEKEVGTIEAVNVTPVKKSLFILSKLIPYWLIAMFILTICFILAWLVYGITSAGNVLLIYLLAVLLSFVFSGFGLIVSNKNSTMQQAVFVMWFCVVCFMLLGGLFTPVRSMPDWAYLTTYVNPIYYFITGVRTVFVRGGAFCDITPQVIALSTFALVMSLGAVYTYKKNA